MATSVTKTISYSGVSFTGKVESSISGNTITVKFTCSMVSGNSTYMRVKVWLNGASYWLAYTVPWGSSASITKTITANGPTNFTVAMGLIHPDTGSNVATIVGNTTLSQTPTSYTVSYNANGGSGAPAAQSKYYGQTLTISSIKPTRTGYTFSAWNTAQNGSGTSYSAGSNYTANADATLYARWNANSYTVSYNANGGANAPSSQTKTYGSNLTLSSGRPTRERYNFKGWAKTNNAITAAYQPGATFSEAITSNITLYAVWELAYQTPVVKSITAVRCDSNGNDKDDGTYVRVTAEWQVDNTFLAENTGHVAGSIAAVGGSSNAFGMTAGGTSSGVATAIVPGADPDTQYNVTVTVTDNVTIDGKTYSGSKSTILTKAHFVLDFKAGGNGIGIGCAAPDSGLEIGAEVTLKKGIIDDKSSNFVQLSNVSSVVTPPSNLYDKGFYITEENNEQLAYFRAVKFTNGNQGIQLETRRVVSGNPVYNNVIIAIGDNGKRAVSFTDSSAWRSAMQSNTCATAMLYGMANVYSLTNAASKLPLSTYSEKDPTGLFSSSSNGIKVARSGSYLVSFGGYVYTNYTVGDLINTRLYRDSTAIQSALYRATVANPYATSTFGPILVSAEAGQTFYLYAYNQSAARGSIGTGLGTYLTVTAVDVI